MKRGQKLSMLITEIMLHVVASRILPNYLSFFMFSESSSPAILPHRNVCLFSSQLDAKWIKI